MWRVVEEDSESCSVSVFVETGFLCIAALADLKLTETHLLYFLSAEIKRVQHHAQKTQMSTSDNTHTHTHTKHAQIYMCIYTHI